jgi:FAD:protein FMN transferase
MKLNFFGSFFCWLKLLLLLAGCQNSSEQKESSLEHNLALFYGERMTMNYKIMIGHELTSAQKKEASDLIQKTFDEVDQICNAWNPQSELSKLNQMKAHVKVKLSPLLHRLLEETETIVHLSQGRFDPTIEPLQQLWKKKLLNNSIPSNAEITAIAPFIGWPNIHFKNGEFYKEHDLTMLDLGGIAKGLCIDLLSERLHTLHYEQLYVEWGGEIRTMGHHPDNRPWTVYISRLGDNNPAHAIATLTLTNQGVATSGDYLQNWSIQVKEADKKKKTITYFHIFDPKKLQPLEATHHSIASVTVTAHTCSFADGLATAAMLFPSIEEAEKWAKEIKVQFPDTGFWLVTREEESRRKVAVILQHIDCKAGE